MPILGGVVWEGYFLGGIYHFCRGYILFLQGVRTTKKKYPWLYPRVFIKVIYCVIRTPGVQSLAGKESAIVML